MNWLISVLFHIMWPVNCLSNAFIVVILLSLLLVQLLFSYFFQLTVFHMNQHEDLDLAILSVLLKGMFTYSPSFFQMGKKNSVHNCKYLLTKPFKLVFCLLKRTKNRLIETVLLSIHNICFG